MSLKLNSCTLVFIIWFLVEACQKQVNIDLPYEGNKLVVNCLFFQDSIFAARVTSSSEIKYILDYTIPNSSQVTLYEDGIYKENMEVKTINFKTYFVSKTLAKNGKTYTLKASAPGFEPIEGVDITPDAPVFSAYNYVSNKNGINSNSKINITIKDIPGANDYYLLRLYAADTNKSTIGTRYTISAYSQYYFQLDQVTNSSALSLFGDNFDNIAIFSDEIFNGKEITLQATVSDYSDKDYIAIELVHLTKDSYRYIKSVNDQSNIDGNPFAEPVTIYSNIKNGYGIVGGQSKVIQYAKKQ